MEKQDDSNTTQSTKVGSHLRKKKIIGVVAVILLLSVFGSLYLIGAFDEPKSEETILNENIEQNSRLVGQGNYDQAIVAWNDFIEDNSSLRAKAHAYKEIASIHINKDQNYQAALESYKQAEQLEIEPDYGLLLGIASLAEQMGDKTMAREYYAKAIGALNPDDPLYEVDKNGLEKKVKSLQ